MTTPTDTKNSRFDIDQKALIWFAIAISLVGVLASVTIGALGKDLNGGKHKYDTKPVPALDNLQAHLRCRQDLYKLCVSSNTLFFIFPPLPSKLTTCADDAVKVCSVPEEKK